ncbi:hypothetical protein BJ508DRAFT_195319, partial [Ascobolus immersus RN42]
PTGSCSFYNTCLESKYKCGSSGYPLGYGKKYCDAFSANRSKFSKAGQKWVDSTMECLQVFLVPHTSGSTCKKIKDTAFKSHSDCYIYNGICDLSWGDLWQVFQTVDFADLFGGVANAVEAFQTGAACL